MTDYQKEIVTRDAPRWAWDVIDETLEKTATEDGAGRVNLSLTRKIVGEALDAMINACEKGDG